jgi:D-serine deaminase-like pyridoxal phosphate-dependent protein
VAVRLDQLETPCVVVDRERLESNLERMQRLADRHGVALRPHAKTHKCLEIGDLQLAQGAAGLTCAKTDEARFFLQGGSPSVTVAYPVVAPEKVRRLLAAAREAEVRLTVDSELGAEVLGRAAAESGGTLPIFLKVDVGFHRCGLERDDPRLPALAEKIARHPGLSFRGLLSHAGQAYAAESAAQVAEIAEQERRILLAVRDDLEARGIEVREISVGSTPTVLAARDFDGITEIRPGNYVFMDRAPVGLGLVSLEEVALFVVSTVVSRNDRYFILDAGSKVLSSDRGGHGAQGMSGFGLAWPLGDGPSLATALTLEKLSEEHGWVARDGRDLPLGSRVRILPNHSCVVANLAEALVICDGARVAERWTVGARGKVL